MRHRTTVLFFGTVIGLAVAYYSAAGQGNATRQAPRCVADALDTLIQPRFQIDAGVFGMERIGVPGHDAIVFDNSDRTHFLAKLAAITHNTGRVATVGFLHCARKPGKYRPSDFSESPPDVKQLILAKPYYDMYYLLKNQVYYNGSDGAPTEEAAAWTRQNKSAVEAACMRALPGLREGKQQTAQVGEMLVVMRPVRAFRASCIGCHSGARRGDTLGAMVYTISK